MTNKTIGFTDAMIQALPSNGGCKSQTRRLMKPQPVKGFYSSMPEVWVWEAPCGNKMLVNSGDYPGAYSPLQIGDIVNIRGTDIMIEITGVRVEIDSIYGEGTSAKNPWVWVYEFKEV